MQKTSPNKQFSFNKPMIIILIVIVSLSSLYMIRGARVYLQWPVYYVKCGFEQPVAISKFGGSRMYSLPSNYRFSDLHFNTGYYCTEQEAINNNFEKYIY